MKESKLLGLTVLCALTLAASCSKPSDQTSGIVRLKLSQDSALHEATKSSVSD